MVMDDKRLTTVPQAAKLMGVNPRTIRRRIDDGTITGYRFGPRLIRVDMAEIETKLGVISPR